MSERTADATPEAPVVELTSISKTFRMGSVLHRTTHRAVRDVTLSLAPRHVPEKDAPPECSLLTSRHTSPCRPP